MPQIPILSGIYADANAEFRTRYPRNMRPVPKSQGISAGYLRPADGIEQTGTSAGVARGAIVWNDICYRVQGTKLQRVASDGSIETLGDVGDGGPVSMDYSFERLAIASGGRLFYWNGATLSQVTDPDLGTALDVIFVDGYFMTTDGTSLVVTELSDSTQVNPLKYGSAEADPDPIKGMLLKRHEVYAVGRHTIEVFENVGGQLFPFARIEGAQIPRGALGTHAFCWYVDGLAFLGGGRGESPAVWLGQNGASAKISTREIEQILAGYTVAELAAVVMETRTDQGHQDLILHLPNVSLVYDAASSAALQSPVWFELSSGLNGLSAYRARHLAWCYGKWLCGDPTSSALGVLTPAVASHYGQVVGWAFGTAVLFNENLGGVVHAVELACLTGRVAPGVDPVVWTSHSFDGETWSLERPVRAGSIGQRNQRLQWRRQGQIRQMRFQRFRGTSDASISVARLDMTIEPLNA